MTFQLAAALILASGAPGSETSPAKAAPASHAEMDHSSMSAAAPEAKAAAPASEPREPGQAAYAAMGEVVRILLADSKTDWSKVDVGRLQRHLADMDNVMMHSQVATTPLPNGARFSISGASNNTAGSIQRMTKSHFAMDDAKSQWTVDVKAVADGAVVTVTSTNAAEARKIAGLGFFGIMTMGNHHRPHHLMMARGGMNH